MSTKAHLEKPFQNHIVEMLLQNGWILGDSANYSKKTGLYTEDVFGWLNDTEQAAMDVLRRQNGARTENVVLQRLLSALEDKSMGTLGVLRNGFPMIGAGTLSMSVRKPQNDESVSSQLKYRSTIFRVVPELSYSEANENRLDLALFINGLPVATMEVKSHYTQHINAAVEQYRTDRPPVHGRHKEPLLTFGRGALVHFAVAQDDVQMCTKLSGRSSYFLPFNRGKDGGRGNDPFPGSLYPAAHLWMDALNTETLLHIIQHLMLHERKEVPNGAGKIDVKEAMIFPRFHQLDVVRKLIDASRHEGPGQRYLIQHSAGSGKSKSIVWTAHGLTQLQVQPANGGPLENLFQSVIIVTDRNVLDSQLRDELKQLNLDPSLVTSIQTAGKGKQLAEALTGGKRIISVTLQSFPSAREVIQTTASLRTRNFAVIIDEAHSSTSGTTALDLRDALTGESSEAYEKLSTVEQLRALQEGRGFPQNISFYAFTATPKAQTVTMFGRPPREPALDEEPLRPEPFHVYTMQQAIEEGFILDVLKNYVSYKTASRITLESEDADTYVRGRSAKREVAKWRNLHPTNVEAKVQIILDHFTRNVLQRNLLDGHAKAMIVTSSRAAAVKYHLTLERFVRENPVAYASVKSLVAFSEEVSNLDVKDAGYTAEKRFTEANLNPGLSAGSLPEVFDGPAHNVLIVANKYQTGFDQPKLVAMYVDKALSGVEAVQTLSRLNRTMRGKDQTFILDFTNKDEEILRAFETYYRKAEIDAPQDPSVVYDLQRSIYQQDIFTPWDVKAFMESFENGAPTDKSLAHHVAPKREIYNDALRQLNAQIVDLEKRQAEALDKHNDVPGLAADLSAQVRPLGEQRAELEDFKRNLQRFGRLYTYISQIIFINDAEMEAFHVFAKLLAKSIDSSPTEKLDLSGLQLEHFSIKQSGTLEGVSTPDETPQLRTATGEARSGKHDEKTLLSQLLEQLSQQLEIPEDEAATLIQHIAAPLSKDEVVRAQVQRNTPDQMMAGDFPDRTRTALAHSFSQFGTVLNTLFRNEELLSLATRAVLETVREANA